MKLRPEPLVIVKAYSLPEFRKLMRTGVTKAGRDMASQGSVMGFVAKALYEYFTKDWTVAKGIEEEKKIPIYFKQPAPRP